MAQHVNPKQVIQNKGQLPKNVSHSVKWGVHPYQMVFYKQGQMKVFIGDVTADGLYHEVGFYENQMLAVVESMFGVKHNKALAALKNKLKAVG